MDSGDSKKTVLVVEDSILNMKLAVDLLEAAGSFNVLRAYDGKTALKIIEQEKPDLIVLDLQLPDIDGFEVIKRLKCNEETRNIKIMIMTASVMLEDKERVAKVGCDAYVPKPINTREFVNTVKETLAKSSGHKKQENICGE